MTWKGKWPGTWATICDVCGFRFPSDKLHKRWDGLMTCSADWELRHPQDFIKIKAEKIAPDFVRNDNYSFRETIGIVDTARFEEEVLLAVDISIVNIDDVSFSEEITYQGSNTPSFLESLTTSETITRQVEKFITENLTVIDFAGSMGIEATRINGAAINTLAINANEFPSPPAVANETLTTSETISRATTKSLTDTATSSETVSKSFTKPSLTDNSSTVETVTTRLYTITQLNGKILNGAPLNG